MNQEQMGLYLEREMGMGFTPVIAAAAPAAGPLAPVVLGISAIVTGLLSVFGFGKPNVRKLNDAAVTEAAREALNRLWYQVSGEALDGVNRTASQPGRYGAEHIALFTESQYPNVPKGDMGDIQVDIDQALSVAQDIYSQARAQLVRPESQAGLTMAVQPILDLLQEVKAARGRITLPGGYSVEIPGLPGARTVAAKTGFQAALPWVAAALAGYFLIRR